MRLLDYIQGLRKGKEAHRLEKESMKDPFLADALDGFRQVEGKHASTVEQLQKQITTHATRQRKMRAWAWSAAACLLAGFGVGSYYLLFLPDDQAFKQIEELTASAPAVQTEDTLAPFVEKDTVQAILPKQDNRRDIVAKAQEPKAVKEHAVEMEEALTAEDEMQIAPDKAQTPPAAATRVYVKLSQPGNPKDKVTGKVVDEHGEPIIGAYVHYKGTDIGTISNADGEFAIEKNDLYQELTAQFIGCEPVSLPVDTSRNMLIAMSEDKAALNEVVVVGYGTQKKSALTGSSKNAKTKWKAVDEKKQVEPVPVIGKKKFRKYLEENRIHPADEACKDCKGKVTVTFFVDSNGNPQHIIVTGSLCESADKEAVRLIKEGPKWTAGKLPVTVEVQF